MSYGMWEFGDYIILSTIVASFFWIIFMNELHFKEQLDLFHPDTFPGLTFYAICSFYLYVVCLHRGYSCNSFRPCWHYSITSPTGEINNNISGAAQAAKYNKWCLLENWQALRKCSSRVVASPVCLSVSWLMILLQCCHDPDKHIRPPAWWQTWLLFLGEIKIKTSVIYASYNVLA